MPDMVHIRLPDDAKEWAEQIAGSMGISLTEYIRRLIVADVESLSADDRALLQKMKDRHLRGLNESREEYGAKPKKASGKR